MSLAEDSPDKTTSPTPRHRWFCTTAVLLLIGFALLPVLTPFTHGGFPMGHDAGTHLTYVYRLDHALSEGQFPVRWVEATKTGHGQPLFNFYQVGFSYVVAFVHLFVPLSHALKATPPLLWWTGAGFMFLLCRRFGLLPAAVATVVFGLSPYLIVDVFVRAAYPEFAAITFGVGVLWALDRLLTTPSPAFVPLLAVLTGLTLICHLPATLIMIPMFAGYAWHLWLSRQTTPERLLQAAHGAALGVGLASFYLLPALLEFDLIQAPLLTIGAGSFTEHFVPLHQFLRFGFDYSWNFGNSLKNVDDLIPLHIAAVEWGLMAAAGCVLFAQVARGRVDGRGAALAVWLGVVALALFMMTAASRSVWDGLAPLGYVQFPWRFLLLVSIAAGAMAAPLVSLLDRRAQALALVAVVALQTNIYHRQLRPSRYVPAEVADIDNPAWRDTPEGQDWGYIDFAFDPVGVTEHPEDDIGRWQTTRGAGRIHEQTVMDDELVLDVSTERGMTVRINSPYFPGWTVRLNDAVTEVTVRPGDRYMESAVPPGTHRLKAEFRNTPVRTWANAVSLVSVLLVGLAALRWTPLRDRGRRRAGNAGGGRR